ncbi:MAG: acyl-CoA carboxylase subunit epsilon [Actinobacteria bacterium]|nr:acyl-CoA carboxylase subunit epsilon [Actinomycetota bacterium]MCB8996350.1 acyl-CoA carboxylase subunit epsilon [Actinomycetota bacterium]MCB9414870.1 acyl-CoA carboxylase subunit epsilon [Actinomycetota bacterium]
MEVSHGNPSDEELAVVVALLTAAHSAPTAADEPQPSNWARPVMRQTPAPGPGAWWRSGIPQP